MQSIAFLFNCFYFCSTLNSKRIKYESILFALFAIIEMKKHYLVKKHDALAIYYNWGKNENCFSKGKEIN
jgi:hypothetical protein